MNKLAPLLMLLFACSLAGNHTTPLRLTSRPVLAAASAPDAARLLTCRLPSSASAVRALARLLRAYAEAPAIAREAYRAIRSA
ncbi:hypothetical protein EJV47_24505 [Hymenobacter gummosus]|uniref:Uncharacterized protein n=1 Tax=Hymenobacter gummosus TaxID=1776032 RepID=A0A3S0HJL2_9BACT|nr:hypothetical protein [Hymenobacter gummosus]RTQ45654.1 hypothetical protein EJV47_24505 [Hymenobacter gummosus]